MTFEQFLANLLLESWFVVENAVQEQRLYQVKEKTAQGGYKLLFYSNMFGLQEYEVPTKKDVKVWESTINKFYKVELVSITVKQVGPVYRVTK